MNLSRGITSFFNWDERGAIPEFAFAEFKRIVFAVATNQRLEVSRLTERSVTPNFHAARLIDSEMSILLLGHATYPLIAFAKPVNTDATQMRFVDCSRIAIEMQNLFSDVTIAATNELNRELTESDKPLLDAIEREQIEYWKPSTIGEVVFNWWD
jgi:hypothetical protein